MRQWRDLFSPAVYRLGPTIGLAANLLGCASMYRPADVASSFIQAGNDETNADALAAPGVFEVVRGAWEVTHTLDQCGADIDGGIRCTFSPVGCDGGAIVTLHLVEMPDRTYRIASAAAVGVFRSYNDPDVVGTMIGVAPCGLVGQFNQELAPYLIGEEYSPVLVPWPFGDPPTTAGDTLLAMSRLEVNRGATQAAVADLQSAIDAGEDTISVLETAAVEAGVTMGLGLARVSHVWRLTGLLPLWPHGAAAYPTDTLILQRGIELLDFASRLRTRSIDWSAVLVLGAAGRSLIDPRTPSIAALDEMNGIGHYQLGLAYLDRAKQAPSCTLLTAAHDAFASASTYLKRLPDVERADPEDAHLGATARELIQASDSTRRQACSGS